MPTRKRQVDLGSQTLNDAFCELRADYSAAKSSRFRRKRTGIPTSGASADYHYRTEGDYLRMMELSRDFMRSDMVVGQGVRRLVANVIRDGFTHDAKTGDETLDRDLEARWKDWATNPKTCDYAQDMPFRAMEALALQHMVVDGDHWPCLMATQQIRMVEAHRIRTPLNAYRRGKQAEVPIHGVLLDGRRRRKEIWVTRDDIDPGQTLSRIKDVEVFPVWDGETRLALQVFRRDRVSQTRGVTHFAPIVDTLGMHDDIQFAKLVQQQIVSCFAIIRELSPDVEIPGPDTGATGDLTEETTINGETRILEGIAPGMDITGRRGEKISGFSPSVPNPEFHAHAMLILTFIAINLDLPVAVLLLDPSKTNFSGWRGAMDQARMGFHGLQTNLIDQFHDPVYRWKVRQWIDDDPILERAGNREGINLYGHLFHPPTWDYIEPSKDATADLIQTRNLLISQRRRCARRGFSWDDLSNEIVEDNAALIRKAWLKAEQLNKEFPGLEVTWREVACLPTPDGFTAQLPSDEPAATKRPNDTEDTADEQ